MRCTTCGSPKHTAERCDAATRHFQNGPRTPCPGCHAPVTAEEREAHHEQGCLAFRKAQVRHADSA